MPAIGKQCFADKYKDEDRLREMGMEDGKPPKWNFTDFVFSFLMVSINPPPYY